jgi:hypothetical protein
MNEMTEPSRTGSEASVQAFDSLVLDVRRSSTLSSRQKIELEELLEAISKEIVPLELQTPEAVQSILRFLSCAIFESTRRERTNVLATTARKGMLLSFRPYEDSHPQLTTLAYGLGDALSSLGV